MTHRTLAPLVILTLVVLVVPRAPDAQLPAKIARVGYLSLQGEDHSPDTQAFLQGLRDLGYVDGTHLVTAFRFAAGQSERLPDLAAALVRLKVDVFVTYGRPATRAAATASATTPIVMLGIGDPVGAGLVASLARPGGNLTGLTGMATELNGKGLELLREAVPSLARVAVLWNVRDATMTQTFRGIQAAAPTLGIAVHLLGVQEVNDIDNAIAAITEERPDALFMITDVLTRRRIQQVVDFAAQRQLPTLFGGRDPVAEGSLMNYGPSFPDLLRRAATYVDRS